MPEEMAAAEAAAAQGAGEGAAAQPASEAGVAAADSDAPPQGGVGGGVGGGVDALERPPHPCFSFGFGGSLAACFPGRPGEAPRVVVSPVEAVLTDAELLSEARAFSGPLAPTLYPPPPP